MENKKRCSLSKYLVQQPQVLILNKVFTGLDVESRKDLHTIINRQALAGTTIILITDEKELPGCITHIAELHNGKLVQYEARKNFIARHFVINDDKIDQQLTATLINPA